MSNRRSNKKVKYIATAAVTALGILVAGAFAIVLTVMVVNKGEAQTASGLDFGKSGIAASAELGTAADAEITAELAKINKIRDSRDANAMQEAAGEDAGPESAEADAARDAAQQATKDATVASSDYRKAAKGADATVSDAHKAMTDAFDKAYRATGSDQAAADADVTSAIESFRAKIG
jgi:hypothetical protein